MKVYGYFPTWIINVDTGSGEQGIKSCIKNQVKKTVDSLAYYCTPSNIDSWNIDSGEVPFPFFFQEDTRARKIYFDEENEKGIYINDPLYNLMFVWEPRDLVEYFEDYNHNSGETVDTTEFSDSEYEEYLENQYKSLMNRLGIKSDENCLIPEGYIYLGSYVSNRDDEVDIPGLIIDSECEDYEALAEEMYDPKQLRKYKEEYGGL